MHHGLWRIKKHLRTFLCCVPLLPPCTHMRPTSPAILQRSLRYYAFGLGGSKTLNKGAMETQKNLYSTHLCCVLARSLCTHIKPRLCHDWTLTSTLFFWLLFTKTWVGSLHGVSKMTSSTCNGVCLPLVLPHSSK